MEDLRRARRSRTRGAVMAVRRQQDVSAFTDLVATRSGALFRTAYLVVGDHQLAQDLLQEALVKAYAAWPRLRDQSKAEAYARRTIVTTATSWRRRRSFHERPVENLPEASSGDATEQLAVQDALSGGTSQPSPAPAGCSRPSLLRGPLRSPDR